MSTTADRSIREESRVGVLIQRIRRMYSGGIRRLINFTEEVARRIIGDSYSRVRLESVLLPGVDLNGVREWGKERRFFIDEASKPKLVNILNQVAPDAAGLIVKEADFICSHIFDLLGSGPISLGQKIDWHVDFKTDHRWNPKTYFKRIRPAPYPGGYDIKVPWELSRCQHFVRLGQAYWISGDQKYAREFVAQVEGWITDNPWSWGVNWACTMDVAIRVVNWLWGYSFFRESSSLSDEFRLAFHKSLLVHGRHIWRNLENKERVSNNHYLADLVGLIYLGILCPEFKEASEWREFGLRELWREMFKQVYPDGVSFEASIAYHRLATELFLSPVLLCRLNDIPVPDEVMARLEKMLEFVMYYTKPDGTVPLIGDADNGRLYRLAVMVDVQREWNDHRYLLAIGAVLFNRNEFSGATGECWQEAVWLFGEKAVKKQINAAKSPPAISQSFPISRMYVMRHNDLYLLVDAGSTGQAGKGGHAHNDLLSFELYAMGRPWLIDPGTYLYTPDYVIRNRLRSTGCHNTLMADNQEINLFRVNELFCFKTDAKVAVKQWLSCPSYDTLIAEHYGYHRLPGRITHQRQFYLHKIADALVIRDLVLGEGRHTLTWNFTLSPGVQVEDFSENYICLKSIHEEKCHLWVFDLSGGQKQIEERYASIAYGDLHATSGIQVEIESDLPIERIWIFYPAKALPSSTLLQASIQAARLAWNQPNDVSKSIR